MTPTPDESRTERCLTCAGVGWFYGPEGKDDPSKRFACWACGGSGHATPPTGERVGAASIIDARLADDADPTPPTGDREPCPHACLLADNGERYIVSKPNGRVLCPWPGHDTAPPTGDRENDPTRVGPSGRPTSSEAEEYRQPKDAAQRGDTASDDRNVASVPSSPPTGDREPDPEWVVVTIGEGEDAERGLAMRDRGRPEDVLRRFIKGDVMTSRYKVRAALDTLVAERDRAERERDVAVAAGEALTVEFTALRTRLAEVTAEMNKQADEKRRERQRAIAERVRGDRLAERLITIATGDIHQSRACVSPDACSCAETFAAETWGADPFDTADHYRALTADPEGGPTDG